MPERNEREALFNHWSQTYQEDVNDGKFPFIGYEQTLDRLIESAELQQTNKVLDLGIGTGALGVNCLYLPVNYGVWISQVLCWKRRLRHCQRRTCSSWTCVG